MPLTEIPTVDLSTGDPAQVELVGQAFEDIGFVYVLDTFGVNARLDGVYGWMTHLFAFLAEFPELREKYAHPEHSYQRGYNPVGNELAIFCRKIGIDESGNRKPTPDWKEHWFIGDPRITKSHPLAVQFPESYAENVWPEEPELAEFQPTLEEIYDLLFEVGRVVLRAVALYIDEPADYFDAKIKNGPTVMRALHYPPFTEEDRKRWGGFLPWGCGHTDINLVTVLPASTTLPEAPQSGLWIRRRDGVWIQGKPPKGCVIVQVGDMLQRKTGKKLVSAVHEVRAPEKPPTKGRLSLAQFIHLNTVEDVTPKDGSLPPMTAGEFLMQRLREIGLAPSEKTAGLKGY